MKKYLLSSMIAAILAMGGAAAQTATTDPGAVINGVKWATRNVDEAGTFAPTPESTGKFYQWNRSVAWAATGPDVTGWNTTTPEGIEWETANDPSPEGWRAPTYYEFSTLLDVEKVRNEWTTQNGVNGRLFTDIETHYTLFIPAAGYRDYNDGGLSNPGSWGHCWSSSMGKDSRSAYYLSFYNADIHWDNRYRSFGLSIRPVKTNDETTGFAPLANMGGDSNSITKGELQIIMENGELRMGNYAGGAVQVFDVMGRTVGARRALILPNSAQTINISHLPAGIYIVKAGEKTGKFVKK